MEDLESCPSGPAEVFSASYWFQPTFGTSDNFNTCFDTTVAQSSWVYPNSNFSGNQVPKDGSGYLGMLVASTELTIEEEREYVSGHLN